MLRTLACQSDSAKVKLQRVASLKMTPRGGGLGVGKWVVASNENDTEKGGMKMKSVPRDQQLHRLRQRYASRGKQGKGRLLDELCEQWGYARKHAIKLLRPPSSRPARTRGRGVLPRYQPIHDVLTHIWQNAEQLCGKRLVSALPLWLPHYARHFATLLPSQRKLLHHVSAATVDRLLAGQRAASGRGLCGTKPGSLLRTQIPIQGAVWDQ